MAPKSAEVLDTLGWLYVTDGKVGKGGALLARAHTTDPDRRGITYRYAAALEMSGDSDKAKTLLKKLLADNSAFAERQEAQSLLAKLGG
jgi:predicted Zn-dependent protease